MQTMADTQIIIPDTTIRVLKRGKVYRNADIRSFIYSFLLA